jgi:hypothetical protein
MTQILDLKAVETGSELVDPRTLYVPPTQRQYVPKLIPQADVELAIKNRAMPRIPREIPSMDGRSDEDMAELTNKLLARIFPSMNNIIGDISTMGTAQFDQKVAVLAQRHRAQGMEDQAKHFESMARSFKAVREMLSKSKDLMQPQTFVPIEYLSHIFPAAPVWFHYAGSKEQHEMHIRATVHPDLLHSKALHFASLIKTQEWADFYLMFNRITRPLSMYVGDHIPEHIFERIETYGTLFDHVVIATPYTDVVAKEWQAAAWQRMVDPYVIGFANNVPFMFILGRFSDSGIFPLHSEMVADTMNFLRTNMHTLDNLNKPRRCHFLQKENAEPVQWSKTVGTSYRATAQKALAAYQQGRLFDYLRTGEMNVKT